MLYVVAANADVEYSTAPPAGTVQRYRLVPRLMNVNGHALPSVTVSHTNQPDPSAEGNHGHQPGSHGGIIVPIGSDSYHAEAVVEKGGGFQLLMLASAVFCAA